MSSYSCIRITADDAACTSDIDRGILNLASSGLVTRVAAFSTYGRLKTFSRRLDPRVNLGIHLNLSSGRPLSKPVEIPSLTDREGRFYCPTPKQEGDMFHSLSRYIKQRVPQFVKNEILEELSKQFRTFEDAVGLSPKFTTVHHDLDELSMIRDVINEILPGLPSRREEMRLKKIAGVFCTFLHLSDDITVSLSKIHTTIAEALNASLRQHGITSEVICHPGYASQNLSSFTIYITQRETELKAWAHESIAEIFANARRVEDTWCFQNLSASVDAS